MDNVNRSAPWMKSGPTKSTRLQQEALVVLLFRFFEDIKSGFLSLGSAFHSRSDAFRSMLNGTSPQHTAYYLTEFLGFIIAIAACIVCIKLYPELGWFSLAVVLISWGSGPPQGIHRHILGAHAVFVALARWGRNAVFDRAWTILSIMLMGALALLFAFYMWVA